MLRSRIRSSWRWSEVHGQPACDLECHKKTVFLGSPPLPSHRLHGRARDHRRGLAISVTTICVRMAVEPAKFNNVLLVVGDQAWSWESEVLGFLRALSCHPPKIFWDFQLAAWF